MKDEQILYKLRKEEKPIKLSVRLNLQTIKKGWRYMKKILGLVCIFLLLMTFSATAETGFTVSTPMQTGVTGFWNPWDDTIAVGTFLTVLRIEHSVLSLWSLDLDGTIAKEVTQDKDTLAGIGIKANYNVSYTDETGFVFIPSIGVTVMNNVKALDTILTGFRPFVYGSVVLYKFK